MKRILIPLILSLFSMATFAGKTITLDDALGSELKAKKQQSVTPMPDGEQYACLEDGHIVAYSYKTGKTTQTLFDPANTIGQKIDGAEDFMLSPDGKSLLIATNVKSIYRRSFTAQWYVYNIQSRQLTALSANGPQQAPVWSPDGTEVAFVRDNNIFLVNLPNDNTEVQVTTDGQRNAIINGIPDWVNEEEFGFNTALTFTADGKQLCWIRYDETAVKTYSLQLFKGLSPEKTDYTDYPGEYAYKYPKAGQDNSVVTAWSYDTQTRTTQQLQVPLDNDGYICRILPTANAQSVLLLTLNRHQDDLRIYSANPRTTSCKLLIDEHVEKYVPEEAYSAMKVTNRHILMISDRDGFRHLYLYNLNGQLERSVCPEGTDITDVYGYDEKSGDIYYQAAPTPMTRHIFVAHRNGKQERLSQREGTNSASFSATLAYYHNTWSDRNNPYVYTACTNRGKVISTLLDNSELRSKLADHDIPEREFFTLTTQDGVTLNGWMMKPVGFSADKKYPVIMHQYSGPASQQVLDSWRMGSMGEGALYDAYLCSLGFIVVTVDGRGTGCRGAEFEKCTYLRLGELESHDQVEAAIWLSRQSYVDADHIGIWGWSFGGFNTLMSMSEGHPVFYAGVAIAPPTNWRYYDSVYTERFMRTPQENPEGYAVNPIQRAGRLHGCLLVCHGLADDNVHPQNTFEYSEALVQADKDFRELVYTNRNHSIFGGNTRRHLLRQVAQHFMDAMK